MAKLDVTLNEEYFGVQPNVPLMHQVVTAQLAKRRAGTQSTKTRSEVRGGGAKPFRQKGTGRARQGSTNAPHYAGGGVALGPKPRSYAQRTPKKMIKLALRSALSDRAAAEKVLVVDAFGWAEPSTKQAVKALDHLGVSGRTLVVLERARRHRRPVVPQPARRAADQRRRAQRLRRAVQRLGRLHPGLAQRPHRPRGGRPSDAEPTPMSGKPRPLRPPTAARSL